MSTKKNKAAILDFAAAKAAAPDADPPDPTRERSFDAADLMDMDLADPVYLCRPWLSEGVTLVVGRPKLGKTTLLRQIVAAANTAGEFFTASCAAADVLFLSLEEGERLMRSKLRAMGLTSQHFRGVRIDFEWPQGAAGVRKLREWLAPRKPDSARIPVVVIDSLSRFRVPPPDKGNAFMADYEALKGLADLAKEFPGLVVLVLHHTTKTTPDDPVAAISGTYGLTAAADNYLVMLKQGQQFRLHVGGRLWAGDISDFELQREAGGWHLGDEWQFGEDSATPKQWQVLDMLKIGAKTAAAIARAIGAEESAVRHMCATLARKGLIERVANGWGLST